MIAISRLTRILTGVSLVCFLVLTSECRGQPYDLPVRVIARADIHCLQYNEYSVRECLDIYNDDNTKILIVTAVTADSWRGHQKHIIGQNWFENRQPVTIKPGTICRIVERKRIVSGKMKRDWWVRWLKFAVTTNRGEFLSNFVASPFKRPGVLVNEQLQPQIDSLSEPQALTPIQVKFNEN